MGKPVDKTPVSTPQSTRLSKTDVPTPIKSTGSIITEQDLGQKKAFPLRIRHTEKFQLLNSGTWRKREPAGSIQAPLARAPASVELLNAEGASKFNVDGVRLSLNSQNIHVSGLTDNSILREGQPIPKEIIAVVRPNIILKENGEATSRTDQQSILPDLMEMNLEVKVLDFVPPHAAVPKAGPHMKVAYNARTTATRKQGVQGLYCFSTSGNGLEHLFQQIGTYIFHFSLVDTKYGGVPPAIVRVNVAPSNINLCDAHALAFTHRKHRSKHSASSVGGIVNITPVDEIFDDEDFKPQQKPNMTTIHVTTLDAICAVNGFFAIAVFLGLGFSPPLPQNQAATTLAPPRLQCYVEINKYRAIILSEVVSFGCFLFSTLVAHGFKLYIILQNGKNRMNSKTAIFDHNFLRIGILSSSIGSILGAIFLIFSMIILIQVRLGDLTCNHDHIGNPWAMTTTIPFLLCGILGCAIFILAVFH